ncbi:uncharacterized protein LOC141613756 isoform X2 [Silene latifolia]|uniref:uncharacterized protein LOC141613756 isoform X2 n=1 Tax=Silene latifolia TaxID=37657 RepID=UPI003D76D506
MVILSENLQKTIDFIKEIVGNHSDVDIYNALKDSNMILDEATVKLLHQDTFHEVRKRRDKKKENSDDIDQVETRKRNDYIDQGPRFYFDRNGQQGRSAGRGISREFGVVQGNKVGQSYSGETKSSTQAPLSGMARRIYNVSSSHVASNNQRYSSSRNVHRSISGNDLRPKLALDFNYNSRKNLLGRNTSASFRAVGIYASSSDRVQLPYRDFRSRAAVGGIRRDIGVGSGGRQSSKSGLKQTHHQSVSNLNSVLRSNYAKESFTQLHTSSQRAQNPGMAVKSVMAISARNRFNNHSSYRYRQQAAVQRGWKPKTNPKPSFPSPGAIRSPMKSASHQPDTSKNVEKQTSELVDKLSKINIHDSQKVVIAQDIRAPENNCCQLTFGSFRPESKSTDASAPAFKWADVVEEADGVESVDASPSNNQVNALVDQVQNSASSSLSGVPTENSLPDNNNSVGGWNIGNYTDMNLGHNSSFYATSKLEQLQESNGLPNFSVLSLQSGNSSSNTSVTTMQDFAICSNNQVNVLGDQVRNSASSSLSAVSTENLLPDNNNSADGCNTENYTDMNSVHNSSFYGTSKSEQLQDSNGLPNFSVMSLQSGNSVPNSSVTTMQQQTPIPQMYSQLQLPHFTNIMPYDQYLSSMFVPPVIPGGYSSIPGYPHLGHLSSESSYVMMPGGGSHLSADALKYGVQQIKSFPAGSPTEFGGLASPTEYVVNAAGVVQGPTGLKDSSRPNYTDNNLHSPNPQAETSEVWVQNQRQFSGMLVAPYLTMQGQATHSAYMQPNITHPSFNTAITQSSQMQFPGMYPPQPAGFPNIHHLASDNVAVGSATWPTGSQLGDFQQP